MLLFVEGGTWVAQVLEKNLAAHGPSPYAALAAVELVLQGHVNFDTRQRREPLSRLKPAPEHFWTAFESARPLPLPKPGTGLLPAHIIAAIADDTVHRSA